MRVLLGGYARLIWLVSAVWRERGGGLTYVDNASDEPVLPEDSDRLEGAVGSAIGSAVIVSPVPSIEPT